VRGPGRRGTVIQKVRNHRPLWILLRREYWSVNMTRLCRAKGEDGLALASPEAQGASTDRSRDSGQSTVY